MIEVHRMVCVETDLTAMRMLMAPRLTDHNLEWMP
jgi:hypothetical protein